MAKPTAEQEQEIDRIVANTSLPRAIVEEQVLAKHPAQKEVVVDGDEDDATKQQLERDTLGDAPTEPKRVVKGTPQSQTDKAVGDKDPKAK